jgi:glycosyltransferase involved in cell wall biosynthesis
MLRFCMITTFYPPCSFGGDAVYVEALSAGLAAHGHEVDVIHCEDSYRALARNATVKPERPCAGVTVHRLRSPVGVLSPLATQQTGRAFFKSAQLKRILASKPFDIIHFHNVSLIGGPAVLSYGSAPKLYTLHEHWLLCPMHTLFRDNSELCDAKRCVACSLAYHRPPQLWRYGMLLTDSLRHVDTFIAPTEFTRQIHLAAGLPMRISVLGNFHEPAAVDTPAASPPSPYFLYAGRLEKLKGVDTLVDAFRHYRDAELFIAGDGSEAPALKRQAADCGHIHFLGRVAKDRLAQLYAGAVALVVPSLAYEVFPLVILEAFAAETPVIARRRGSLEEIVIASGGGLLFGDQHDLVAAMQRLQADRSCRDALGRAGGAAWRAKWTADAHLRQYLTLVDEVRVRGAAAAAS